MDHQKPKNIFTLDIPEAELLTIGVSTHLKFHRLIYEINKEWGLPFERMDDWHLTTEHGKDYFARTYFGHDDEIAFVLFKNKGKQYHLSSKFKQMDYLFCTFEIHQADVLSKKLNTLKSILFQIPIEEKAINDVLIDRLSEELL